MKYAAPHQPQAAESVLAIKSVVTPADAEPLDTLAEGPWDVLVKTHEASPSFQAQSLAERGPTWAVHDRIIDGLGSDPRFDPASVPLKALQHWIWVSARDDHDEGVLRRTLNVLLVHAVHLSLRPESDPIPPLAPLPPITALH